MRAQLKAKDLKAGDLSRDDGNTAAKWKILGTTLFGTAKTTAALHETVAAFERSLALDPQPETWFRLGVALRRHYELDEANADDFQRALDAWGTALDLRPNQYIWRRRIEQYGPRLDKPYSFYDWVKEAREAIRQRGESPHPLRVEPRGAELAFPQKRFPQASPEVDEPSDADKIHRDTKPLVRLEKAVAPARIRPGRTARLHLVLRPESSFKAHWNNESRPLAVWLRPPPGVQLAQRFLTVPNPATATSDELRQLETEARVAPNTTGTLRVPGYALYYVCEGVDGTCLYLRQDFEFELKVASEN